MVFNGYHDVVVLLDLGFEELLSHGNQLLGCVHLDVGEAALHLEFYDVLQLELDLFEDAVTQVKYIIVVIADLLIEDFLLEDVQGDVGGFEDIADDVVRADEVLPLGA